ncbi:hypothetical protein FGE12_06075 [Aggregicoccus sp. 17bor-14]|uniref:PPC domain-containing protein n=1 Tax=Myxococcaceae TaxID=31 RepID=UPI00129C4D70|nr:MULTISPECIES: PPC domain-containing protein [Myxococcaceae]MBF5041952.1 PPC domain-containing protein [Simulacricoccus sp. 17bor-14]MRI87733.1 hypothetical protein [Aggregicoccus sp. 17bor-14]
MSQFRGAVALLASAMLALAGCSGNEAKLVITTQPASGVAGEPLGVVVQVQDGDGKALDVPAKVTLKLSGEGASLGGTVTQIAQGGKATFADAWVEGGGAGLVLEASAEGVEDLEGGTVKSASFDVEAVALRFEGLVQAYRASLPLDAFRVSVVSAKDGRVVRVARPVKLGVGNNPTGAVLSGAEATTVDGVATFDALRFDRAGQGYTLSATAPGASATSGAFSLSNAADEREPKDKTATGAQLNDTFATAEPLQVGLPLFGDLTPSATEAGGEAKNDVDTYRFSAHAGQLLEVATYATRLDQANWKHGIRVTLVAAKDEQVLFRIGQNESTGTDLDFGLEQVRIPADGDYLLVLEPDVGDSTELDGGRYATWVQLAGAPALLQLEQEEAGKGGGNDSIAAAEAIAPGVVYGYYEGLAGSGTTEGDYYKFEIAAPTRVRFALTAHRNGMYVPEERPGYYDPALYVYTAEGVQLWNNDDTYWYDSSVELLLSTPGTYYVRVTRCCNTGAGPYFLSFSAQGVQAAVDPGTNTTSETAMGIAYGQYVSATVASDADVRWYKFSGKAGDLVELYPFGKGNSDVSPVYVDALLYSASDLAKELPFEDMGAADVYRTILVKDGEYLVRMSGDRAGSFTFLLERAATSRFETEPNDTLPAAGTEPQASAFDAQGWASGIISNSDTHVDVDSFAFQADANQLVSVSLYGNWSDEGDDYSSWGSALNAKMKILDRQGNVLASVRHEQGDEVLGVPSSLNRMSATMEISFRAPARGDYYLVVEEDVPSAIVVPTVIRTGRVSAMGGIVESPADPTANYYAVQLWKNQ